jgi:urease accessory protein
LFSLLGTSLAQNLVLSGHDDFMNKSSCSFSTRLSRLILSGICLAPGLALAHPGHYHPPGEDDEFDAITTGFLHPLSGLDHLILALAVGWLAFSWKGGKARLPFSAFLISLVSGAFIGRGLNLGAGLEMALALTLIAAGAAFVTGKMGDAKIFASAISIAGLIHGFAHGSEAAANVPFISYTTGFTAGTAVLLGIGALLSFAVSKLEKPVISKIAGTGLLALGSISLIQAL